MDLIVLVLCRVSVMGYFLRVVMILIYMVAGKLGVGILFLAF
jgi:hypothetical protein